MLLRCCVCNKPTESCGEVSEGHWVDIHDGDERVFLCDHCYHEYLKSKKPKEQNAKWDEKDWYIFDCPTCGRDFVVDNDYDSDIVCTYDECPACVSMYNAGV
jgi:hypothetical protein